MVGEDTWLMALLQQQSIEIGLLRCKVTEWTYTYTCDEEVQEENIYLWILAWMSFIIPAEPAQFLDKGAST